MLTKMIPENLRFVVTEAKNTAHDKHSFTEAFPTQDS